MRGFEIRYPDRTRLAGCDKLFERLPCRDIFVTLGQGPVDEEQIDVVQTEALQGFVKSANRAVIALVCAVQFGRDEEIFAAYAAIADALAHAALIAVFRSGVDVTIPGCYRRDDHRCHRSSSSGRCPDRSGGW